LCGESFESITASHLKFRHNTTLDTYTLRFPDAVLTSPDLLRRRNDAIRATLESWNYREEKSRIMTEVCSTPEWTETSRLAQLRRFEDPKEHRKLSEAQFRRYEDPEEHRKTSLAMQTALEDPQVRRRMSEAGLARYDRPGEREKTSKAVLEAFERPEVQERKREAYQNPLRSKRLSEASSKVWSTPGYWEAHSGENSPFWKGGQAGYGYAWGATREHILIRDNYTCQICKSQRNLQVHHIDHDRENILDPNLITLCRSCNVSELSHPEWKVLLQQKVKEIIELSEKERY